MPLNMRLQKEKLLKDIIEDPKKAEQNKHEEMINPWQITDEDFHMNDNPFDDDNTN